MGVSRFSVLRLLADGEFHSGGQLERSLGLSRSGVGSRIRDLESLGLRVSGVRGRGYRLAGRLDLLDHDALAERLRKNSPLLTLELLDECASTNSALGERAARGAAHGTLLACEHQSAGRGRRGSRWHASVGGSLAFSLLWRFPQGAGALAGLSLAVAVGAVRALVRLGVADAQVKWPNDIYLGGRKLGGILIELSGAARGPSAAVIGVGINVRLGAPARRRIDQPAADLAAAAPALSRGELLAALAESLAAALAQFSREGFAPFREEWLRRHAWQGRCVALSLGERRVAEGEVLGIAEDGALMLRAARGIERFHSGELSLRPGRDNS